MEPSVALAIVAAGIFFLTALLTGVWKYLEIRSSEQAVAHPYVDIAHRTSLMYSLAALLLARFAEISELPANVEWWAVLFPVVYFAYAILLYIVHGALKDTENQFKPPFRIGSRLLAPTLVGLSMWSLVVAEIGGFLVLFYGVLLVLVR